MFKNPNHIRDLDDVMLIGFYTFIAFVILNIILWVFAPISLIIAVYSVFIGCRVIAHFVRKRFED